MKNALTAAFGMLVAFFVGMSFGQSERSKAIDTAHKRGAHEALYKRPVSEALELVCAGLWVGEQNKKHQEKK